MANLVVIEWVRRCILPAACDDDGSQLSADLSMVMPGEVRLVYLWRGGGQCLRQLQEELCANRHVGNGWFLGSTAGVRSIVRWVPLSTRSVDEHPGLHTGSAGAAMTALRAAAGPDLPAVGRELRKTECERMPEISVWGWGKDTDRPATAYCDCTAELDEQPPTPELEVDWASRRFREQYRAAAIAESRAAQHGSEHQPGMDGSNDRHIAEQCAQTPDTQVPLDAAGNTECACGNLRTNGRCEDCDSDLESSPYDSPPHRRYKRARRAELQMGTYAASPALEEASFAALPPTAPQGPTTSAEDVRAATADSGPCEDAQSTPAKALQLPDPLANWYCEDRGELEGSACHSPLHRPNKRARRDEVQLGAYAASPALEEASFAALPATAPQAPTTSAEDARAVTTDSGRLPWQECLAPSDKVRADTAATIRRHIEQHFGAEAAELALQKYAVKAISVRGCCKRVLVDDLGVPQRLQLAK